MRIHNSPSNAVTPHDNEVPTPPPPTTNASNQVSSFDNQRSFDTGYSLDNHDAAPVAGGSMLSQAGQAAAMTVWTELAARNLIGDATVDSDAGLLLKAVSATPPDAHKAEVVNYTSTITGTTAQAAFEYFKKHPNEWFGASGITLHPPISELKDGARVALAEPTATPPVMAPIEIHIDEAARTVSITTLDGHPLRGVNQFTFEDAAGGCEMHQSSAFELSSFAAEQGSAAMKEAQKRGLPGVKDPIERQHEIWQAAHAKVADGAER